METNLIDMKIEIANSKQLVIIERYLEYSSSGPIHCYLAIDDERNVHTVRPYEIKKIVEFN